MVNNNRERWSQQATCAELLASEFSGRLLLMVHLIMSFLVAPMPSYKKVPLDERSRSECPAFGFKTRILLPAGPEEHRPGKRGATQSDNQGKRMLSKAT